MIFAVTSVISSLHTAVEYVDDSFAIRQIPTDYRGLIASFSFNASNPPELRQALADVTISVSAFCATARIPIESFIAGAKIEIVTHAGLRMDLCDHSERTVFFSHDCFTQAERIFHYAIDRMSQSAAAVDYGPLRK